MKFIGYEDLNSLWKWMNFIVNDKEVFIEGQDCSLKILDDDDDSYLLINMYDSNVSSTEYYFKPDDTKNGLLSLVMLLGDFDFSLRTLTENLPALTYVEDEIGLYTTLHGLKIFKDHVKSN